MTYRFSPLWKMCSWKDTEICLQCSTVEKQGRMTPITDDEVRVLSHCDGVTDLDMNPILEKYLSDGTIIESNVPAEQEDMYVEYPFVRRSSVQWSITGGCNYRCLHCFAAADSHGMQGYFSLEKSLALIDELAYCGLHNVELTGGEPLVHPYFKEIVEAISLKGMKINYLHTNGALLTQEIFDLLNSLGQKPAISMSFDGLGTHDWMRNHEGAEAEAFRAMALTKENGYDLRININVNAKTAPRLIETCRYLAKTYNPRLYLIRTSESPCWKDSGADVYTLSFDECLKAQVAVAEAALREKWGIHIKVFNGFTVPSNGDMRSYIEAWKKRGNVGGALFNTCAMSFKFYISHDGRVLPCNVFDGMTAATGEFADNVNVFKRPLSDILADSDYTKVFEIPSDDYSKANANCAACKWYSSCRGGCRAFAYAASIQFAYGTDQKPNQLHKCMLNCAFFSGGFADKLIEIYNSLPHDEEV